MKLEDVSQVRTAKGHDWNASVIIPRQGTAYPMDREKEALFEAIKTAKIYSVAQARFAGDLDEDKSLEAVGNLVARANAEIPFTCYCILRHEKVVTGNDHSGTDSLVCLMLFKAIDSSSAASSMPATFSAFGEIQIISAHAKMKREWTTRIDEFFSNATCIAIANQRGLIPLWQA